MSLLLKSFLVSFASAIASVAMFFALVLVTQQYCYLVALTAVLDVSFMAWGTVSNGWQYAVGFTVIYAALGIGLPILGGVKSFLLASLWGSTFFCTIPVFIIIFAKALFERFIHAYQLLEKS